MTQPVADPQLPLFFEDVYDALRAAVQAIGGIKRAATLLWPGKPADVAGRELADALNRDRPRKLDPEETLTLMRAARDAGFHSAMVWWAGACGYDAQPVTRAEEVDRATLAVESAAKALSSAMASLERIQRAGVVRAA